MKRKKMTGFLLLFTLLIIVGCGSGKHKNTTGMSQYQDSDIGLNCEKKVSEASGDIEYHMDFAFNKDNYQLTIYTKMIITYSTDLTDSKYDEILKDLSGSKCSITMDGTSGCKGNPADLGISSLGMDTKVYRDKNKLEATFYNSSGLGKKASSSDIKKVKKEYEDAGCKCQ